MSFQYKNIEGHKCNKFFRVLKSNYPQRPYDEDVNEYNWSGHWGQRKLLFSEIEYLSVVSRHLDLDKEKCLIVYIGAANGIRDNLYKTLFSNTQWLLYDPMPFAIKSDDQFIIKTGNDGFFTNGKIDEVLKIANKRHIVYLCDIRSDTSEPAIWNNMQQQQYWGIMMNAEFMLLKFRLPYTYIKKNDEKIDTNVIFPYDTSNINDKIIISGVEDEALYLSGKILFQLHAPKKSTESRLLTYKAKYVGKKDIGDKYLFTYYNSKKYEEQMCYFNMVDRPKRYCYKNSADVENHIIGYDQSYDLTGEYFICCKYFKHYKKEKYDHSNVVKLLNGINIFMHQIMKSTSLVTYVLKSYPDVSIKSGNENVISKHVQSIKSNYQKQKNVVKRSDILTDAEKSKQLDIYDNRYIKLSNIGITVKFVNGNMIIIK